MFYRLDNKEFKKTLKSKFLMYDLYLTFPTTVLMQQLYCVVLLCRKISSQIKLNSSLRTCSLCSRKPYNTNTNNILRIQFLAQGLKVKWLYHTAIILIMNINMIQIQESRQNNFHQFSYTSDPMCTTSWQNLKEMKTGKTSYTLSIMLLMLKSHSLVEEKGFPPPPFSCAWTKILT